MWTNVLDIAWANSAKIQSCGAGRTSRINVARLVRNWNHHKTSLLAPLIGLGICLRSHDLGCVKSSPHNNHIGIASGRGDICGVATGKYGEGECDGDSSDYSF